MNNAYATLCVSLLRRRMNSASHSRCWGGGGAGAVRRRHGQEGRMEIAARAASWEYLTNTLCLLQNKRPMQSKQCRDKQQKTTCSTYTVAYVGTVLDILNTRYILKFYLQLLDDTFAHQSGLDESSRQSSTVFQNGVALLVYLMFSEIGKNTAT